MTTKMITRHSAHQDLAEKARALLRPHYIEALQQSK